MARRHYCQALDRCLPSATCAAKAYGQLISQQSEQRAADHTSAIAAAAVRLSHRLCRLSLLFRCTACHNADVATAPSKRFGNYSRPASQSALWPFTRISSSALNWKQATLNAQLAQYCTALNRCATVAICEPFVCVIAWQQMLKILQERQVHLQNPKWSNLSQLSSNGGVSGSHTPLPKNADSG